MKFVPEKPHVILARGRSVSDELYPRAHWHRGDLHPDQIAGGVATSKELTLLQCMRSLPDDQALAVADSAARAGPRAEAANPFEAVLRSICDTVPGLHVEPQVLITTVPPWMRPDLVDREMFEAEYVREVLVAIVEFVQRYTEGSCRRCAAREPRPGLPESPR